MLRSWALKVVLPAVALETAGSWSLWPWVVLVISDLMSAGARVMPLAVAALMISAAQPAACGAAALVPKKFG